MITPFLATKDDFFVGDECAFCRRPLAPGDPVVLCPIDEVPHHSYCWEANGNHCSGFGCAGRGALTAEVAERPAAVAEPAAVPTPTPPTARRPAVTAQARPRAAAADGVALPSRPPAARPATPAASAAATEVARMPFTMQLAQSCLVLAIALAIVVIAFSCFGLWAILDYVMIDVLNWSYRVVP